MKDPSPRDLGTAPEPRDDDDDNDLWHETVSALGLIGAVAILAFVISLVGRL